MDSYADEGWDSDRMDADLEMTHLTALGNRSAALKRQGICPHGWLQERASYNVDALCKNGKVAWDAWLAAPVGSCFCLDCGKLFPNRAAAYAEHDEVIGS